MVISVVTASLTCAYSPLRGPIMLLVECLLSSPPIPAVSCQFCPLSDRENQQKTMDFNFYSEPKALGQCLVCGVCVEGVDDVFANVT